MSLDGGSLVPVTGASGYIGGRLLKAFESAGRPVRCLARRPIFFDQESLHPRKLSKADCLERSSAPAARGGVHTAHPDPPSPKPMNRLHRAFPYTAYTVFFHSWNSRSPCKTHSKQPERAMAFPGIREEPLPLRRNAFRGTSFDIAQPWPCFNLASTSPSLRCGWDPREHRGQESVFARESRRERKGVGKNLACGYSVPPLPGERHVAHVFGIALTALLRSASGMLQAF